MSGSKPNPRVERRQTWAQQQLGSDDNQPAINTRAALLNSLRDANFAPLDAKLNAYKFLTADDKDQPLPGEFLRYEVSELESTVNAFANKMFDLPPDERRAAWKELNTQCQGVPRMMARVEMLSPGLDLDATSHLDEPDTVRQLAGYLLELFVLPPIEKARRRCEIMRFYESNFGEFVQSAGAIAEHFPEFKALDPEFIDDVQLWSTRAAKAEMERRKSSGILEADDEIAPYDRPFTGPVNRGLRRKPSNPVNSTLAVILGIGFIISIGALRSGRYESDYREHRIPQIEDFDLSDYEPSKFDSEVPYLTDEQMQSLMEAIREREDELTVPNDVILPGVNSQANEETEPKLNWKHIILTTKNCKGCDAAASIPTAKNIKPRSDEHCSEHTWTPKFKTS